MAEQNFMEHFSTSTIDAEVMVSYLAVRFLIPLDVVGPRINQRCMYKDEVWLIDDIKVDQTRTVIYLWRPEKQATVKGEDWRQFSFEKNGKCYRKPNIGECCLLEREQKQLSLF